MMKIQILTQECNYLCLQKVHIRYAVQRQTKEILRYGLSNIEEGAGSLTYHFERESSGSIHKTWSYHHKVIILRPTFSSAFFNISLFLRFDRQTSKKNAIVCNCILGDILLSIGCIQFIGRNDYWLWYGQVAVSFACSYWLFIVASLDVHRTKDMEMDFADFCVTIKHVTWNGF